MKSDRQPVTLEDLLRLKRAERPSPEFWQQFERELRTKQLAAIVDRRPWWAPVLRGWVRMAHLQVPVGATAILALTFLTVREYRTPGVEADLAGASAPVAAQAYEATEAEPMPAAPVRVAPALQHVAVAQNQSAVERVIDTPEPSLGDVTHVVPLLSGPQPVVETPSARSIAANLAAVQDFDPELAQALAGDLVPATRPSAPRVDPLSRLSSPSDARRARLLAGSLPASAMYATASLPDDSRSRERLTSRLEDRLYDSVHRVDLDGRSVSIKF